MKTLGMKKLNTKVMSKKTVIAVLVASTLISTPLMATENSLSSFKTPEKQQQQDKKEELGFGIGAIIGAVLGGPIGAMATGIAGNYIAQHINSLDDVDDLSTNLAQEKENHQTEIAQYQGKLQSAEQSYQAELLALEQSHQSTAQLQAANLLMSLQFSTGSSEIAPHYQEQVAALAEILNNLPSLSVDLSGYTDLTGEQSLNQQLSLARVESVKTLLMAQGVDEQQISTFAYGEDNPVVASSEHEASFYDRRVVVKLHSASTQTANNY